jgi:hypothetical protein
MVGVVVLGKVLMVRPGVDPGHHSTHHHGPLSFFRIRYSLRSSNTRTDLLLFHAADTLLHYRNTVFYS